ncbi:MAG: family 20 glycosylhydrolase [Muribaculaceae bacterium]|nr:family 20 glycosylhydrolase [Muribaculaceae bacterium]
MRFILSIIMVVGTMLSATARYSVDIVPAPVSIVEGGKGAFTINDKTSLYMPGVPDSTAATLAAAVEARLGDMAIERSRRGNQIELSLTTGDAADEGYTLSVDRKRIKASATSPAGLFYAVQTLGQLADRNDGLIPDVTVTDTPRFPYRGVMIDVSRNFRDKEFIKKQIDAMAALKLNRLHLHLTDGAGWRIEIDRYPRLTEFAAWRPGETWKQWGGRYLEHTDPEAHGGYYTKDDIREIVDYAARHYITVIPEIEMPAHSEEVLAAYPELSCAGEPYKQPEFCVGNEQTFEFLQNVLDEIIELFPSHYINIGGDEASKVAWKTCEKCQKRMADEGLKDVDELQSYLIHRIERYVNSKGRDIIGWDEIMEGGLAPNATVLSWRGPEHGIKAAGEGHKTVMAPGKFCYLDGYQDVPHTQPEAIGGYLPLELVYSYDPAPDSLAVETRNNIQGIEATMFTEYIATDQHAEYMLYPRVLATAEIGWTPQEQREYTDFRRRALQVNDDLRGRGYNAFDLHTEIGNRPEWETPVDHLARGKRVIYNDCQWAPRYCAAGEATFTDGLRGGWFYNDMRWQGFYNGDTDRDLDVTIDMETPTDITYIGADFIQLCGPNVWFPEKVIISCSDDGENFTMLTTITTNLLKDNKVAFRTFSWQGNVKTRYVRYQAFNRWRFVFTDEIIIR